ncbi:MAG: RNA 2',3'-cyclic phosphodiesterase [Hydrogenophilaceae bacterium]|jgi:2'-5' RNA ligase|nr:RNA 2',3'-cyclic phosphodiesterase [Hydrogenophilaceae bacterium]
MSRTHQRLFFALWPGEDTRRALWQVSGTLHQVWNGRRMKPDTLHMTLVFLGDTPVEKVAVLREIAAAMDTRKFEVTLNHASCWRHNKVGFLSPEDSPPELLQLVYGLEDKLEEAGIAFDERPYKPHLTLLRNTRCTTQVAFAPIHWHIEEFVLVSSTTRETGPAYQLIGRWPLK